MARTVLVIDDEPDIRDYLIAVLEDRGYEAMWAEAGQDMVQVAERRRPDLILLDIMMPHRSGIAIYKALRTAAGFEQVPIVMISGLSFDKEFSQAMSVSRNLPPPDGFIEKPIKLEALVQTIDRLLTPRQ